MMKIAIKFLRLTLVLAIFASAIFGSWFNLFVAACTLGLTFLPAWLESKYRLVLPLDFEFAIVFFIYASLFLGETHNFYDHFWWWDVLLHVGSAIAFGFIGFLILFILFKADKVNANPFWIAVFSFCFAVSVGAIWEVFEFSMDQLFGFNMQKSGLVDTMWDIIIDSGGALVASVAGYAYMKGSHQSYLAKLVRLFIKSNPNIVK